MITKNQFENFVSFLEQSKVNGNVDILKTKEVIDDIPCFYFPKYSTFGLRIKHNGKDMGRILFDKYIYSESDNSLDLYMNDSMVGWFNVLPRYKW